MRENAQYCRFITKSAKTAASPPEPPGWKWWEQLMAFRDTVTVYLNSDCQTEKFRVMTVSPEVNWYSEKTAGVLKHPECFPGRRWVEAMALFPFSEQELFPAFWGSRKIGNREADVCLGVTNGRHKGMKQALVMTKSLSQGGNWCAGTLVVLPPI